MNVLGQSERRELVEASAGGGERVPRAGRVAAAIRRFGGYDWVGLYDVGADAIAVVAWAGEHAPAHPRFPVDEGLCGAAVAARATIAVGDVANDPRYLTTHGTTRSEIVVPVCTGTVPVGLIDVASDRAHAFAGSDEELLEGCAALISPLWSP